MKFNVDYCHSERGWFVVDDDGGQHTCAYFDKDSAERQAKRCQDYYDSEVERILLGDSNG